MKKIYNVEILRGGLFGTSDDFNNKVILTVPIDFEFESSITGESSGTVILSLDQNLTFNDGRFIELYDICKILSPKDISEFNELPDKLIEGVITNIEVSSDKRIMTLTIGNFIEILKYQYLSEEILFEDKTLSEILTIIEQKQQEQIENGITGGTGVGNWFKFNSDNISSTQLITIDYKIGESLYDFFNRLKGITFFYIFSPHGTSWIESIGYKRYYLNFEFYDSPIIDRTLNNSNYIDLYYNSKSTKKIGGILKVISKSLEKFNYILGVNKEVENQGLLVKDETFTFTPIGLFYSYENGKLIGSTESIGQLQLNSMLSEYLSDPRVFDIEFTSEVSRKLEIGQKIKINIIDESPYLDFSGDGFIIGKRIELVEGYERQIVTFGGSLSFKQNTLLSKLYSLKGGVNTQKNLQNKTKITLLN